MTVTSYQIETFLSAVWQYYDRHGRHDLPWRQPAADGQFDPYRILVSELMLQQTQVGRVIPKFTAFLAAFPTVEALAAAPLGDVLIAWQGLGYNRRAKFLWQAAQLIVREYDGVWPTSLEELIKLPGVGRNTAGAVLAYAFNQPALFVETNIRTVYFHHFFADRTDIADSELLPLLDQTLDQDNPRIFYWALMDYGTYLKQQGYGRVGRSKHYVKQSRFEGSARQLRGAVLRHLSQGPASLTVLLDDLADDRSSTVLQELEREGLIRRYGQTYKLA